MPKQPTNTRLSTVRKGDTLILKDGTKVRVSYMVYVPQKTIRQPCGNIGYVGAHHEALCRFPNGTSRQVGPDHIKGIVKADRDNTVIEERGREVKVWR